MEVALADIQAVAAAGWKIAHYRSWRGSNFVGMKGEVRIRGEKHMNPDLALQELLDLLIRYDEEARQLT